MSIVEAEKREKYKKRRWNVIPASAIDKFDSVEDWWNADRAKISRDLKRHFDGLLIYCLWNVWKERNRRVFNNVSMEEEDVASKAQEDFKSFLWANEVNPVFNGVRV
ncbi:hypothetical protein BRADI_1g42288v3 [Brachypodium distachyon]|uniref:Uncharacterized protein n=1 Tax=Brachypodium distachyon TaxID=15368 RepID=A0A2K2DNU6_BRADI|nr:hypothetical protein BRADI_1g42288v3 [Brachypodium distachyon]